jgi:hypothetical protein
MGTKTRKELDRECKELSGYVGGLVAIIERTAIHQGSGLPHDVRLFIMESLIDLSDKITRAKGDAFDKMVEDWKKKLAVLKNQN